jgi:NTP pyrophosphatase (non-canonical NTP hydrolase)
MSKSLQNMMTELLDTWNSYEKQGTLPWTREVAANDLQYQIGSLAKLILQLQNYRYRSGLNEEEIKSKMADELADIIAEALFIADGYDIDIEKAWDDMLESDRRKIRERTKS